MNSIPKFASAVHEVADAADANELYQSNGWTDGLPIVAPTEDAVARFLAAAQLDASAVIGVEPVRRRSISAEKIAIAAVMAGCLPEYLPVVVAIVKAMCQPEYALHGSTASTGGSAPFIVVNGPVRQAIGMNMTHNALANAARARQGEGAQARAGVRVAEWPAIACIVLRGRADDGAFLRSVQAACGVTLPTQPGTTATR